MGGRTQSLGSNIPSVATAVGCVLSLVSVLAAIVVAQKARGDKCWENLKVVKCCDCRDCGR